MGPRSPSTSSLLLLETCRRGPGIRGGPAALVAALEGACRERGVTLHTDTPVKRIRTEEGRITGVELSDGSVEDAPIAVAACSARVALGTLLEPGRLPLAIEEQVRTLRCRGGTAKLHLAVAGTPSWAGAGELVPEQVLTAQTPVDLEKAFDPLKYGDFPTAPQLEVRNLSAEDPDLAPEGHSTLSIMIRGVPHNLREGWSESTRERLLQGVLATLETYAPGLGEQVVGHELLTPVDLEEVYGLPGGHLHHGEHGLDQLWLARPGAQLAEYCTPIEGLYLGASSSHPGGGITCRPGVLAAEAVLKHDGS